MYICRLAQNKKVAIKNTRQHYLRRESFPSGTWSSTIDMVSLIEVRSTYASTKDMDTTGIWYIHAKMDLAVLIRVGATRWVVFVWTPSILIDPFNNFTNAVNIQQVYIRGNGVDLIVNCYCYCCCDLSCSKLDCR